MSKIRDPLLPDDPLDMEGGGPASKTSWKQFNIKELG
jgi:hypothetical protein